MKPASFEKIFRIDPRTLALFRICLGMAVASAYLSLLGDLRSFFTDFGVLPWAPFISQIRPLWSVSVFLSNPAAGMITFFFFLAILFSLALAVGWKTRASAFLTWFFLSSLHARNPYLWHAGDQVLRCLAFWAMFLPLGEKYAWDAPKTLQAKKGWDLAALALKANILIIFIFAGSSLSNKALLAAPVLMLLPFLPSIAWKRLAGVPPIQRVGDIIAQVLTRPWILGAAPARNPLDSFVRRISGGLAVLFTVFFLYLNITAHPAAPRPAMLEALNTAVFSHHPWKDLAIGRVSASEGWYAVVGTMKSGATMDIFSAKPVDWENRSGASKLYRGLRWRILIARLIENDSKALSYYFLRFATENWNQLSSGVIDVERSELYLIQPSADGAPQKNLKIAYQPRPATK